MIFDSVTAKELYIEYAKSRDPVLLERLHVMVSDLIKVIALSLDRNEYYDDLVQEGHLKFHRIIINLQFRVDSPAAMYTFLSKVLRNYMIDYLRKIRATCDLDSITLTCDDIYRCDTTTLDTWFNRYYPDRFPSLYHGYNYAEYAYDAIIELVNRNKAINTLLLHPQLTRPQAIIIYRSVSVFIAIATVLDLTPGTLSKSLKYAHNGSEFTLLPESKLAGCSDALDYNGLLAHVSSLRAR